MSGYSLTSRNSIALPLGGEASQRTARRVDFNYHPCCGMLGEYLERDIKKFTVGWMQQCPPPLLSSPFTLSLSLPLPIDRRLRNIANTT